MSRRRYVFDEARTQRFFAEGRGQGVGANYKPWLQIQDVPSLGRSHRPFGIKTQRVHHFLSDGEWKFFQQCEHDPRVCDLQEQFPMDRIETSLVARELGFRHPITLDGTPYVMTIDLLLTLNVDGKRWLEPYTFKYYPDTLTPRELELIAIAKGYWRLHGYELKVVDETHFKDALVRNYDGIRTYYDISNLEFFERTDVQGIADSIMRDIDDGFPDSLLAACQQTARVFGVTPQIVYAVTMHLIARDFIRVDLTQEAPLPTVSLSSFTVRR